VTSSAGPRLYGRHVRVVVAGRGWLAVRGARLFSMLADAGGEVVEVVCLPIADDVPAAEPSWLPSLRAAARRHGWPVVEKVAQTELTPDDLFLSLQFDRIVHVPDLGGARALNLHFAPLPRHRGSLSCVWPILERDAEAGVTLHELTAQVDAGPVVAARSFPLPASVTAGELYRIFHREGFGLLAELAVPVLHGTYRTSPQADGAAAHRRADIDFGVREITDLVSFAEPADVVRAACLARIFPEYQLPSFQGRPVTGAYTLRPRPLPGAVGDVVARTATSALVRCSDGLVAFEFAD
jgi:methionyl-tRNA formyltransferase